MTDQTTEQTSRPVDQTTPDQLRAWEAVAEDEERERVAHEQLGALPCAACGHPWLRHYRAAHPVVSGCRECEPCGGWSESEDARPSSSSGSSSVPVTGSAACRACGACGAPAGCYCRGLDGMGARVHRERSAAGLPAGGFGFGGFPGLEVASVRRRSSS